MKKTIVAILLSALAGPVSAQPVLSNALQSGMVVQQNQPFRIWGKAIPGQEITVKADWTAVAKSITGSDSNFLVMVSVPAAKENDFTPHRLVVEGAGGAVTLDNLLIGDLWFCSGQSNMQFSLKEDKNAATELPKADYPYIRLLRADLNFSATPIENFRGKWETCTPATAKEFSAVGYSFGRDLFNTLHIPVGLVWSGIGASAAQAFVPQGVLAADTLLDRVYLQPYLRSEKSKEKIDGGFSFEKVTRPFLLYNAMIHPFRNLSLKGFCWYQGESNRTERTSYTQLMYAMIQSWRLNFGQGVLPFYYVQVAPYYWDKEDPVLADYAFFREAQERISLLGNTGMAVTMDVGEAKDLHPKNKLPIGHRLAAMALKRTYGKMAVVDEGPVFDFFEVRSKKMIVHYRGATADGLKTSDGKEPSFFEVAGADQKFYPAKAMLVGNLIELSSAKVSAPVAVRYAFTNYAVTNLENGAGFPAVPFRSDNFTEPAWPK
ncbi:MAG: sialate O-acetylesterase [Chitinophagaceae bacterium]|nr:MAG: sialate O-acetylesterase [Chitinophagaceae bacterium]